MQKNLKQNGQQVFPYWNLLKVFEVDKLDINKLKDIPTYLSKLSDAVDNDY